MLIPVATHCRLATLRPIFMFRRSHYKITLSLIFNLMCTIRPKKCSPWPGYVSNNETTVEWNSNFNRDKFSERCPFF